MLILLLVDVLILIIRKNYNFNYIENKIILKKFFFILELKNKENPYLKFNILIY